MSTLKTTIEWPFQINGETDTAEQEITVEYHYFPASKGIRDSFDGVKGAGPPLEPDEPSHVEITAVLMSSPTPYNPHATEDISDDLSESEKERLETMCLEQVSEDYERDQEERQDYH